MSTENCHHKSFDDVKCVWMKSGTVDYKLCDMNFMCENCAFDKKVRIELNKFNSGDEDKISSFSFETIFELDINSTSFTHPYYRFGNSLVLKYFIGNNYYIGLEEYFTKIVNGSCVANFSSKTPEIHKGDSILKLSGNWGELNITAPFDFRYLEKFEPTDVFSKGKRWFGIIEADKMKFLHLANNSAIDKFDNTKKKLRKYYVNSNQVGVTMYDGGESLKHLYQIIGKKEFLKLVKKLTG